MKASLVVMAAGMGSRFGGLKQVEPVGNFGETIADFCVYDAIRAGFSKVYFIIKRETKELFIEKVVTHLSRHIACELIYQDMDNLPEGFVCPADRKSPWGTGHAALCAKGKVNEPFMLINADDFYGQQAFSVIYQHLRKNQGMGERYCMAGYALENTLSEFGSVSRGLCSVGPDGLLINVEENTGINQTPAGIFSNNSGPEKPIPPDTLVSLNAWGFYPGFLDEAEKGFRIFLENNQQDLSKVEYYLTYAVEHALSTQKATVSVLPVTDRWYGFTYKEDKPIVTNAIQELIKSGKYPEKLWG